ncbi:MAG: DUF3574 domain-containing protein [Thermoclostridium sp.]|nr:DUF3574 domain-containing protein [Thermoclostridium sp.]
MKKKVLFFIVIMLMSVPLSACLIQNGESLPYNSTVKYTMYIGLNDQDTYTQLIPYEEAEKKVNEIALKHVDGFTQMQAKGAYKDDEGVVTYENSLVYEFSAATDEQMKAIMDEVLKELNQHSILLEKQTVKNTFYEGDVQ